MAQHSKNHSGPTPTRTLAVFSVVALVWFALDRITKILVDTVEPGTLIYPNIAGLFEFRLVHNTGAAWGIFGNATFELGCFSVIVCMAIIWYVFGMRYGRASFAETIPLALVFAGGLGNAVDRLLMGYVVDFINCTFINFPTFNVADIGVTCGMIAFCIGFIATNRSKESNSNG